VSSELQTGRISKRVVLYFPGFDPLDAKAHHARYARASQQSAKTWDLDLKVAALQLNGSSSWFDVYCTAGDCRTETRLHVLDHNDIVLQLKNRPLWQRLCSGYCSALRIVAQGGFLAYARQAWRFALFFVFPFMLVALAVALTAVIAAMPLFLSLPFWTYLLSIPLAAVFFRQGFMPLSARTHTLHLFADWELAVAMGSLDRPGFNDWLEGAAKNARAALQEEADEYVIVSHSMGSTMAAHVLGMLLEREPELLSGKRVIFMTLGGAVLQCALLRPATVLRNRVAMIARAKEVFFLEIQCLTDPIHFYRSRVVALCGYPHAPQAKIAFIRMRNMLLEPHYRKIKRNLLRVHRQYVLGSELRSGFDFTLMTAGPVPAACFENFTPKDIPAR
jgi:hypothetical protein